MNHLRAKETRHAPQTSTRRKTWRHRRAGSENRGRGQGRHTRPLTGRENRSRGRCRHTRTAGSPPPNLVPDRSSETLTPDAGQGAGNQPLVANVGTTFLLAILGLVIALTGIAHLLGGFELADRSGRRWRPGVPLGILEIGLGTTLILTADRDDSLSTWLASASAILGGAVLISDALLIRRRLPAPSDHPACSSSEVAS
jgi:hypothetical protein